MARADCPQCEGSGWRVVERASESGAGVMVRAAVRCDCSAGDREARALEVARIPRRYEHCSLANFETDTLSDDSRATQWDRSLEQAKLVVQGFVKNYPAVEDQGLLLMGNSGVGKTHLAVAALKELVQRGHEGLFFDYNELLKQIQSSYNAESQTTEMAVLEPVLRCEILLLDDLGSGKPSAWALETVGHILNTRYNEKRVTLITTNFLDLEASQRMKNVLPSGGAVRTEDSLADRIGQRIRSRLFEMCRTVEMFARDYRREIRRSR